MLSPSIKNISSQDVRERGKPSFSEEKPENYNNLSPKHKKIQKKKENNLKPHNSMMGMVDALVDSNMKFSEVDKALEENKKNVSSSFADAVKQNESSLGKLTKYVSVKIDKLKNIMVDLLSSSDKSLEIQKESLEEQKEKEYRDTHKKGRFTLKGAVQKVKAGGTKLVETVKKAPEALGFIGKALKFMAKAFLTGYLLNKFWPLIKEKLYPWLKEHIPSLEQIAEFAGRYWKEILTGAAILSFLGSPIKWMLAPFTMALKAGGMLFKPLLTFGKTLLGGAFSFVKPLLSKLLSPIVSAGTWAATKIKDGAKAAVSSISSVAKKVSTKLNPFATLDAGGNKVQSNLGKKVANSKVVKLGKIGLGKIGKGLGGALRLMKGLAKMVPFLGFIVLAYDLIDAFFPEFWSKIGDMFSVENIVKMASKIKDFVMDGFNSIGKWFEENVSAEKMGIWVREKITAIKDWIVENVSIEGITKWVSDKFTAITTWFSENVSIDAITTWVSGAFDGVITWFEKNLNFENIYKNISDFISKMFTFDNIKAGFGKLFDIQAWMYDHTIGPLFKFLGGLFDSKLLVTLGSTDDIFSKVVPIITDKIKAAFNSVIGYITEFIPDNLLPDSLKSKVEATPEKTNKIKKQNGEKKHKGLEGDGTIETNLIKKDEIKDWGKIEKQSDNTIQAMIDSDNFSRRDINKLQGILDSKNKSDKKEPTQKELEETKKKNVQKSLDKKLGTNINNVTNLIKKLSTGDTKDNPGIVNTLGALGRSLNTLLLKKDELSKSMDKEPANQTSNQTPKEDKSNNSLAGSIEEFEKNIVVIQDDVLNKIGLGTEDNKDKTTITKFATGGYTGKGKSDEVAGLVHKNEYVMTEDEIKGAIATGKTPDKFADMNKMEKESIKQAVENGADFSEDGIWSDRDKAYAKYLKGDKKGLVNAIKDVNESMVSSIADMFSNILTQNPATKNADMFKNIKTTKPANTTNAKTGSSASTSLWQQAMNKVSSVSSAFVKGVNSRPDGGGGGGGGSYGGGKPAETFISSESNKTGLSDNNVSSLEAALGKRESTNNYNAVNRLNYIGKYQFGAMALTDLNLVKKGTSNRGLNNPGNWKLAGGKEAFLGNHELQENSMDKMLNINAKYLGSAKGRDQKEISGMLAASHLLGAGGAKKREGGDANGTTWKEYYALGRNAVGKDESDYAGGGTTGSASSGSSSSGSSSFASTASNAISSAYSATKSFVGSAVSSMSSGGSGPATIESGQKSEAISGNNGAGFAKSLVGKIKYVWGGKDSNSNGDIGLDCSGFIQYILKKTRPNLKPPFPGGTEGQNSWCERNATKVSEPYAAGDILFFKHHSDKKRKVGHIAMAIGPEDMVHSSGGSKNTSYNPGTGAQEKKIKAHHVPVKYAYRLSGSDEAATTSEKDVRRSKTQKGVSAGSGASGMTGSMGSGSISDIIDSIDRESLALFKDVSQGLGIIGSDGKIALKGVSETNHGRGLLKNNLFSSLIGEGKSLFGSKGVTGGSKSSFFAKDSTTNAGGIASSAKNSISSGFGNLFGGSSTPSANTTGGSGIGSSISGVADSIDKESLALFKDVSQGLGIVGSDGKIALKGVSETDHGRGLLKNNLLSSLMGEGQSLFGGKGVTAGGKSSFFAKDSTTNAGGMMDGIKDVFSRFTTNPKNETANSIKNISVSPSAPKPVNIDNKTKSLAKNSVTKPAAQEQQINNTTVVQGATGGNNEGPTINLENSKFDDGLLQILNLV